MKRFIKTALLTAVVLIGQQAFAQNEEKTLLKTEQIAARLGLDETQKAKLDKELRAAQLERKERMEKYKAIREEMKRDAFVERQGERERLKEILTDEQLEKLKTMRAERGPREFRGRPGSGRPEMREGRFDRQRMERFRGQREQVMKHRMQRFKEEKKGDGGN